MEKSFSVHKKVRQTDTNLAYKINTDKDFSETWIFRTIIINHHYFLNCQIYLDDHEHGGDI